MLTLLLTLAAAHPPWPPGLAPHAESPGDVAAWLARGELGAAAAAAWLLASRRDTAPDWLAAGWTAREIGRLEDARVALARAARDRGPVQAVAAHLLADVAMEAGRPEEALTACAVVAKAAPRRPEAEDCEALTPIALADLGRARPAEEAARAWDSAHPLEPVGEVVALRLARAAEADAPAEAARRYARLTVTFTAPATLDLARAGLARLAGRGVPEAREPDDLSSLRGRALSLREAGRLGEAWALFLRVSALADAASDAGARAWVAAERSGFLWRCRQWDALHDDLDAAWADSGDPAQAADNAWYGMRAASRGGRGDRVITWFDRGAPHLGRAPWRGREELAARTLLLAHADARALPLLDDLGTARGTAGQRNAFAAGLAALGAADIQGARRRFDGLIGDGVLETEARYWRAEAARGPAEAAEDRTWVLRADPGSWYGLLLAHADGGRAGPPTRDGRFPRDARAVHVGAGQVSVQPQGAQGARDEDGSERPPAGAGAADVVPLAPWATVRPLRLGASRPAEAPGGWRDVRLDPSPLPTAPPDPWSVARIPAALPAAAQAPDPERAWARLVALSDDHGRAWPDLAEVVALAPYGLTELTGRRFARFMDAWRDALRRRDPAARALERATTQDDWRAWTVLTGDAHDAARQFYGVAERALAQGPDQAALARLGWPLAHAARIWRQAREADIDPLLVLALMRTESIYDPNAVSRVGARGPMQIMPRTGHLLAWRLGNDRFIPADLHDPGLATAWGVAYLGLLMERFDGAWPLAIAAYNAGPHNVSAWLGTLGHDVPLDVLVERIPYKETRNYVRHIAERYATYARLYAHPDARLRLPAPPWADRPEVVDF